MTGAGVVGILSGAGVGLLTGFLGSGKTTLLNHWVKQPELGECAVLINEFGSVGLDHHLVQQVDALPAGAHWQVIGIGARQWPLVAAAITLGGNVRVGLEDNLYLAPGRLARSNGELVAKAAELVRLVGGEVASVGEAREMLELPLH